MFLPLFLFCFIRQAASNPQTQTTGFLQMNLWTANNIVIASALTAANISAPA